MPSDKDLALIQLLSKTTKTDKIGPKIALICFIQVHRDSEAQKRLREAIEQLKIHKDHNYQL